MGVNAHDPAHKHKKPASEDQWRVRIILDLELGSTKFQSVLLRHHNRVDQVDDTIAGFNICLDNL